MKYRRRNEALDCVSRTSVGIVIEPRGNSGKIINPRTGTAEANVVVRVAWRIVQVECLHPRIAAIVPIAAADEAPPAIYSPHPYAIIIPPHHDV